MRCQRLSICQRQSVAFARTQHARFRFCCALEIIVVHSCFAKPSVRPCTTRVNRRRSPMPQGRRALMQPLNDCDQGTSLASLPRRKRALCRGRLWLRQYHRVVRWLPALVAIFGWRLNRALQNCDCPILYKPYRGKCMGGRN